MHRIRGQGHGIDTSRFQLPLPAGTHTLVIIDGRMDTDTLQITVPGAPPLLASLSGAAGAQTYDPATDQFFLVDTEAGQGFRDRMHVKASRAVLGNMNPIIIIHELDHALGGQHFPLRSTFAELMADTTLDQQMAVMSLVEGDATFVMIDHQKREVRIAFKRISNCKMWLRYSRERAL